MIVDYLPLANGLGANVIDQAQFVIDVAPGGSLEDGFVSGLARSNQVNKVLRQSSVMTAALANYIADLASVNVLDDGDVAALEAMLLSILSFTNAGTGAVLRLIPSRLKDSYSVFDVIPPELQADIQAGTSATTVNAYVQQAAVNCVALGFKILCLPAGKYVMTAGGLTLPPGLTLQTLGAVEFTTTQAAGRFFTWSDQYGGAGAPGRPVKWIDGDLNVVNTNGANTCGVMFIGGATNANGASFGVINGLKYTGFNGAGIELGYNAFCLRFENTFSIANNGAQIKVTNAITNSGENILFTGCRFGGSTGAQAGPLMDINTAAAMSFIFLGCSSDYLTRLNVTGNSCPKVNFTFFGGNLEANMTAEPYLTNDGLGVWAFVGVKCGSPTTAGYSDPMLSETTGGSTTNWLSTNYTFHTGVPTLHKYTGSYGYLDYTPNWANAATVYVDADSTSVVGYAGEPYERTSFVATLTGCTTAPTTTIEIQKKGNSVVLQMNAGVSAVSNGVTKTLTGMPARFWPPVAQRCECIGVSDNGGAYTVGLVVIETTGVITIYSSPSNSPWTAAGTAAVVGGVISYMLD